MIRIFTLWKIHWPRPGFNLWTSDPMASMITTGPPGSTLSDRMNGHRYTTTVSNPDLPVAIHTQSHQIPFQECWSVSAIYKLADSTLTTFAANLTLHINTSSNHDTPPDSTSVNPHSTLALAALTISSQSLLFYCWGKPRCFGQKSSLIFVSSVCVLATPTCGPDDTIVCLR